VLPQFAAERHLERQYIMATPDPNQSQPEQIAAAQTAQPTAPVAPAPVASTTQPNPATPTVPGMTANAQPSQPNGNNGQPNATATQPSQPTSQHAKLFDRILQTISGGPRQVMITDPVTGNSRMVEQPQTRSSLAQGIVAAALSGMYSPTRYVESGPGGAPRIDSSATSAGAFQAGKAVREETDAKAQALADEAMSRKLLTAKNNISAMRQYAALAHEQHQDLDATVAINQPMLDDAVEHDKSLDGSDPSQKAILAQGLTWAQAQEDPNLKGKLLKNNLVVSGSTTTFDPKSGTEKVEPLYTILNPDARLTLGKNTVDVLSKINPQYAQAYDLTSGNIQMNVRSAVKASHDAANVSTAEDYFERAAKELGTPETQDLFSAVRNSKNKLAMMNAIDMMHTAIASASPLYRTLDAIRQVPGSEELFKAIGLDGQKVDQYINTQVNEVKRQAILAAEGGVGPKAPAGQDKVTAALGTINSLPSDQQVSFKARLVGTPTNAEVDAVDKDARAQYNENRTAKLAQQKENEKNLGDDILTTADALGYMPHNYGGSLKEYNKRQGTFKKNVDDTMKMEGTYQQFNSILNDINAGKELTGAASVVALFNAIGISATPLAGKGFRINNNTVEEHANSISMPDNLVKKAVSTFKNGEVVTPQQIKDYAQIAADTRVNQYVNLVNQAHGQGLNADFILPTGNGAKLDTNTAKIFKTLTGNNDAARKAAIAKGWNL
jgi:hypothetical protein